MYMGCVCYVFVWCTYVGGVYVCMLYVLVWCMDVWYVCVLCVFVWCMGVWYVCVVCVSVCAYDVYELKKREPSLEMVHLVLGAVYTLP